MQPQTYSPLSPRPVLLRPQLERAYCKRCFPDASSVEYATCNPATGRNCFAKHVLGVKPTHGCAAHVVHSPRLLAKRKAREEARASGGSGASASGGSGARPHAQRRV